MTGQDLIDKAESRKGCIYRLGAIAPKDNPDYKGAFDCAELVSWAIYQCIGKLYGCENDNSTIPAKADAGTTYWERDLSKDRVKAISITEARATPGAILLRDPESDQGIEGHIVFSKGDGTTIEAMGRAWGVTNGKVDGRRWSDGILIPEIIYDINKLVQAAAVSVIRLGVYNNSTEVKDIQRALVTFGYHLAVDGLYGTNTAMAVQDFQDRHGLTPDGEVGPATNAQITLKS